MKLIKELKKKFPKETQEVLEAFIQNPCCSEERNLSKRR